jgi:hypothetical protein
MAAADVEALAPRPGSPTEAVLLETLARARSAFVATASPRGVFEEIDGAEFHAVYGGGGCSLDPSPVTLVVDRAERIALFAVTLAASVSRRIRQYFAARELAEGYLLDQIASFAADALASKAARRFAADLSADHLAVLPYSPGYCGWSVSGQHPLFERLRPAEIGVTVNDSGLMQPIKSVSGVLVAAPPAAHAFEPAFPCCADCAIRDCRLRIERLRAEW